MLSIRVACLVLALLIVPCPSFAQTNPTDSAETTAPADDRVDAFFEALDDRRFDRALEVARTFDVDELTSDGRAMVYALQASALLGLKKDREARRLIEEIVRLRPSDGGADSTLFLGALMAERYDIAADTIDRMIARYPDVVRELDWSWVRAFYSNEPKDDVRRNEDRKIDLARIGLGGESERADHLSADAVEILVKRGDYAKASEMLSAILEPTRIEDMLILRRYEPLWPVIEAKAGAHLSAVQEAFVQRAHRIYDRDPNDPEKLQNLINALRISGRLDQAIAFNGKLPADSAAMSKADVQMGWAINNVALALHRAGRKADADKLFALLNEAPMPKEYWRISMKINRLDLLVQDGKAEQALPLIEPTAALEKSDYADQLVRRLRYCTLMQLGRTEDAAKHRAEMLAKAADAPGPTIDGLLCANEVDAAEKLALELLRTKPEFEADFVRQLNKARLTSDDPSVWQPRWQVLRARPAIRAEFDRLGRDLPAHLAQLPSQPEPAQQ